MYPYLYYGKNDVRPDKLYAFIIISFSVFTLDVAKV